MTMIVSRNQKRITLTMPNLSIHSVVQEGAVVAPSLTKIVWNNSKKEFNNKIETDSHKVSVKKLKSRLRKKFPKLKIEFNVMALNNSIKKFK